MTKMDIAKFFSSGQFDKCFDYLTDETVWNTPGEQYLRGRAEIEGFCKKIAAYFDSLTTDFRQLNVIADGIGSPSMVPQNLSVQANGFRLSLPAMYMYSMHLTESAAFILIALRNGQISKSPHYNQF